MSVSDSEEIIRNLVAIAGAQTLALTILTRLLVTKNVISSEEISRLLLGSLETFPPNEKNGVAAQTLRSLANSVQSMPKSDDPVRH